MASSKVVGIEIFSRLLCSCCSATRSQLLTTSGVSSSTLILFPLVKKWPMNTRACQFSDLADSIFPDSLLMLKMLVFADNPFQDFPKCSSTGIAFHAPAEISVFVDHFWASAFWVVADLKLAHFLHHLLSNKPFRVLLRIYTFPVRSGFRVNLTDFHNSSSIPARDTSVGYSSFVSKPFFQTILPSHSILQGMKSFRAIAQ